MRSASVSSDMGDPFRLNRFLEAQDESYPHVLARRVGSRQRTLASTSRRAMPRCLSALLAVVLGLGSAVDAASFPVLAGAQQAVVVTASDLAVDGVRPAEELARCLRQATGRVFAVIAEQDYRPEQGLPVHVGAVASVEREPGSRLRRLDADAYLVSVTPERIALVDTARAIGATRQDKDDRMTETFVAERTA